MLIEQRADDSKTLAKSLFEYIKMRDILRDQFYVYKQINSTIIENREDAIVFIDEVFNKLDYSYNDIRTANAILETKFKPAKMKSSDVDSHIAVVIQHKLDPNSRATMRYVESRSKILEYVNTDRDKELTTDKVFSIEENSDLQFLTSKHVIRVAINEFNKTYSNEFSDRDREVFNLLRSKDESKINEYYKNMIDQLSEQYLLFEDNDLQPKFSEALDMLKLECSTENFLSGYDLLSELKDLANER